jgi:ABC-type ATPase with predicted acetyltransferase domain
VNSARTPTHAYTDTPTQSDARVVAVGVLSYPVPSCRPRERWFGLGPSRRENLVFANANLRTISRVIVHPQFRSLGLSTALVGCLCAHCDTRYVEAIAQMGHVHPLFTRAGMTRTNADHPEEPAYFILDRHEQIQTAPARRAA